jgi:chromosome segregation ATPase
MLKRIALVASFAGLLLLGSCGLQEKKRLEAKVDSLQTELMASQEAVATLNEVGTLIDSIDASRRLLRTTIVEGTTYDDYVERMEDINKYVRITERKIETLEKSLKSYRSSSNTYAATIKKLKADLERTNQELVAMQETVTRFRNENDNLLQTVALRDAEIEDKISQIKIKEDELVVMEKRINDMAVQSKQDEAQSYFARAQVVEELANRTKFAPRKRKESREQALELYRMALMLGKEEAQPRIAELEKKL